MITKFIKSLAYWTELAKGVRYQTGTLPTSDDWIIEPNGDALSSNRDTVPKKSKGQNGHPAQNPHFRLSFHESELKWITEERISEEMINLQSKRPALDHERARRQFFLEHTRREYEVVFQKLAQKGFLGLASMVISTSGATGQ